MRDDASDTRATAAHPMTEPARFTTQARAPSGAGLPRGREPPQGLPARGPRRVRGAGAGIVVVVVVVVVGALASGRARACGPEFPHRLLLDCKTTMSELVEGNFAWEAAHLVTPSFPYVVVEGAEPPHARDGGGERERALYDAGARAFHQGDTGAAVKSWRALLALPAQERQARSTWAAFMIGQATGDVTWLRRTRALARAGFADTLGLAAFSLGEEARDVLPSAAWRWGLEDLAPSAPARADDERADDERVDDGSARERSDSAAGVGAARRARAAAGTAGGDSAIARAVHLYAEQAALGSVSGRASLSFLARRLLRDDAALERNIGDPVVQRLVAAALFTAHTAVEPARLGRLIRLVDKRGLVRMEAADRLAAVAYGAGEYEYAKGFARLAGPRSALARWIEAKLALRDGDDEAARRLLAAAAAAFPEARRWGEVWHADDWGYEELAPRARVDSERAVLALDRREYAEALSLLLSGGEDYWLDAAYVAERVMTTDELVRFVHVHAPRALEPLHNPWGDDAPKPFERLRALLARRLVREGRVDDALAYFDDHALRADAARYGRALARGDAGAIVRATIVGAPADDASAGAPRIGEAQARFEAATLLRKRGMEISGTELDPDWAVYGGTFDLGASTLSGDVQPWRRSDDDDASGGAATTARGATARALPERLDVMAPRPPFASYDEELRVAATAVHPLVRFHYRAVAAALAGAAADELPPRSQAFAATLCAATSYLIDREPERADVYYDRYVREGAWVPFAGDFGRDCPAPDFAAAARGAPPRSIAAHVLPERARAWLERAHTRWPRGSDAVVDTAALLGLALVTRALARAVARRAAPRVA